MYTLLLQHLRQLILETCIMSRSEKLLYEALPPPKKKIEGHTLLFLTRAPRTLVTLLVFPSVP